MPNIAIIDLPAAERDFIERVHGYLQEFGCSGAAVADLQDREWVRTIYPRWNKSELFPFFLAEREATPLFLPSDRGGSHIMLWLSTAEAKDLDRYEAEMLAEFSFLLIGFDSSGNYIALDTAAESGLDVVLIDYGGVAGSGVSEKYIARTGQPLDEFLMWVLACPLEFKKLWKRHYSQTGDS